jgi:thiazole synthase
MAHAIRIAIEAGLLARGAGRIARRLYAEASTQDEGRAQFEHPSDPANQPST